MPKPNKLRHRDIPAVEAAADAEAAAWLGDVSDVREVTHFADGSLAMVRVFDGRDYDVRIEFNAPLAGAVVRRLRARGIQVERG